MFEQAPELTQTTRRDIGKGYDMQGYNWSGHEIQKTLYRNYRRQIYPQYQSIPHDVQAVRNLANCIDNGMEWFKFRYSVLSKEYKCRVNHFQLRDLVWASSSYDVYYCHMDGAVYRWNPWLRSRELVLGGRQMPSKFKLSAMCVDQGVVFAGDYEGRYCIRSMRSEDIHVGTVAAANDMCNHATPGVSAGGGAFQISVAHNSGYLRHMDVASQQETGASKFDWAINCSAVTIDGSLHCVVGDTTEGCLLDPRQPDRTVAQLPGHSDYSFACSFSPDGRFVATGSQDTSVRIYDVRRPQQALATLCGYIGAMRVVRFSGCGRYLLAAEPADYVHVYDTQTWTKSQDIEFMGEMAGAAFSPDSNCLFVGISDTLHGSGLAEFASID